MNTQQTKRELLQLLEEKELRAARKSFWQYCVYHDENFFSNRPFLKEVAKAFQLVHDEYVNGKAIRVCVSMPPRAGKSYITSMFCAWWLGKFPHLSVMRNSCTSTLYGKFSYNVRDIVKSAKWRKVFPGVELAADKQNLDGWNLTTAIQVSYFGAGVGGTIIGFGANLAITDDLYKDMADALSPTVQDSVEMWKESAHDSRKEKNCPEIYIGTRWTKRDVIGKAIDNGKIDHQVTISALTEDGESFCEDVKSTAEYLEIKEDIDETVWLAEYMQQPVDVKGLLFPESELLFYNHEEFDISKAEHKAIMVDPADQGGDYYASPLTVLIDRYVYIPETIFDSLSGVDVCTECTVDQAISNKVDFVQVEGNSGWVAAGKDMRKQVHSKNENVGVRIIKAVGNKQTRILNAAPWIKKYVRFRSDYKNNKQYASFIKNLTEYLREGKVSHDDAPDVLSQIAEYYKKNFPHLW